MAGLAQPVAFTSFCVDPVLSRHNRDARVAVVALIELSRCSTLRGRADEKSRVA
jgi:hypothetical protein